ncbi:hypothetical protein KIW84_051768 [Lathyrus oleraceus]|uniref:Clathrin/coatomer adaptor adaptin-like N-terminal domain-containing protein n=1 Tax=Pisum sativum TaxID=3888 RepID=A0A9D4WNI4_PEA|nr:hypothetical protein KIW84_051768 [Pisum sativum]
MKSPILTEPEDIVDYNRDTVPNKDIILGGERVNIPFPCDCINGDFLAHIFSYDVQTGDIYASVAGSNYANLTNVQWLRNFNTYPPNSIPDTGTLNVMINCSCGDKVIAAMTVGKDVSSLFTDMVNLNTFVKDSQDPNPLIRALAVRTMGCIRVDKITEYLCDPLQRCLKDDDPYVRKTAAICVAKLYDINAKLVEDRGFLESLKDLISDNNPMVVANVVAALAEIQDNSSRPIFEITSHTLSKLLTALNECTEWGQVFILDALSRYKAADAREAENIVERVTPRLQHANCAVVLSAVKMILQQMELITSTDVVRNLCKKMAPPLVTLLSAEPEIQFVALRNINLIVQRRPTILAHEIKVFFCKYNDPVYVKMEKLEIMIKLASDRNMDQVLLEFKEMH